MAFALVLAAAGAPSEPWQSQSLHPEPLRLAAFGPQPLPLYAHSLASGEIRQEDNSSLHTVLRPGDAITIMANACRLSRDGAVSDGRGSFFVV